MWRILWTVNEFYVYYVQTTVGKEKFIPIIVNHAEITNANCNISSQIFAHAFSVYISELKNNCGNCLKGIIWKTI